MESIIGINKDKYIFKGKEYNIFNIRDLLSKLNKNRRIIIFNENIFIKKYKIGEKDLEKFINEKLKRILQIEMNFYFIMIIGIRIRKFFYTPLKMLFLRNYIGTQGL